MAKTIQQRLHVLRESFTLRLAPNLPCNTKSLRTLSAPDLEYTLNDKRLHREWANTADELLRTCPIRDGTTEGVNPGDRRAVWYLIKGLAAAHVLEIGTHVGASTLYIAA